MRATTWVLGLDVIGSAVGEAGAGPPRVRRARPAAVDAPLGELGGANANAPSPYLGTFYPTNYVLVRGNNPVGGGYSPNSMYGESNLVIYGPTSIYRQVAAPVTVYRRGYDGVVRPELGTTFSNPNLPGFNPVVYPNSSNLYYGPRSPASSGGQYGPMFIDHN